MADTLTITDNRTGKQYQIPIQDGTIRAMDLRQIKVVPDEFGMMTYDPAFMNTASCRSRITFIDGDEGVLLYRGYPIEQLAEHSDFLETAYLILFGELPTDAQHEQWTRDITQHTMLHTNISKLMEGFQYDAHPMGMFISTVGALSTFYTDAKNIFSVESRRLQTIRLIAKVPTIAAYAYRHSIGRPYNLPDNDLSYAGNFLNMLFRMTEPRYKVNPVLERALDVLFILHADHEQNCSTSTMRNIGSSQADPYSSLAGAAAALYGPLHGGANEAVLRMLTEIGSIKNVPAFIKRVKGGDGRLMGFGHRVYKSVRSARDDHQADGRSRLRRDRQEPVPRDRAGARADRARGRILRDPQALSERRLLLGPHLPGDGLPRRRVPRALRDPPHGGLDRAVGGDAHRRRPEDRAPPADLRRAAEARLRVAREEALTGMPRGPAALAVALAAVLACARAQTPLPAFDGARALEHARQLTAIGPRVAGSPGAQQARDYIAKELTALGLKVQEQPFDAMTPLGRVKMVNVIVPLPGKRLDGRLLVTGHYDTKLFRDVRFVGANDGGSSAAFLLEIARVLKDWQNALPIELVFFDGEEAVVDWQKDNDHTYGSQYYVDAARKDGTLRHVKAMVLVDMIGDRDLRILRDRTRRPG